MGQDFYEKYPSARQIFDQASQWLSLDMKALCFEKNDRLNLTEYTQAALVTTCLAMDKVVEECGLHPDITAGLSLGEYCAMDLESSLHQQKYRPTAASKVILRIYNNRMEQSNQKKGKHTNQYPTKIHHNSLSFSLYKQHIIADRRNLSSACNSRPQQHIQYAQRRSIAI